MLYLVAAAIICAIQAASAGGNTYRVMLFSIILTYGGRLSFFSEIFRLIQELCSMGGFKFAGSRSMAYDYELRLVYVTITNLYQCA